MSTPQVRLRTRGAACSEIGPSRRRNEDSFVVHDGLGLYAVADGVGGAPNGDWASSTACQVVRAHVGRHEHLLAELDEGSPEDVVDRAVRVLADAFQLATEKIYRISGRERLERAGTTCSAVLIRKGVAILAHIGDSRVYRLRGGEYESWTTDHIVSQEGTDEARRNHPAADYALTRALGPAPSTQVDTLVRRVRGGDVIVLCTDGCHGGLEHYCDLRRLTGVPLDLAPHRLVRRAYANGSTDNATCVCVQVEEDHAMPRAERGRDGPAC